jgi:hypothetical protein
MVSTLLSIIHTEIYLAYFFLLPYITIVLRYKFHYFWMSFAIFGIN